MVGVVVFLVFGIALAVGFPAALVMGLHQAEWALQARATSPEQFEEIEQRYRVKARVCTLLLGAQAAFNMAFWISHRVVFVIAAAVFCLCGVGCGIWAWRQRYTDMRRLTGVAARTNH